ncbi:ribokinase [Anaerostipes sp. MSJ-23]|uniref:ribokinase n=1 Tax=Anaerostipes sp. MSJ-23 TaxID=2841520 RepID=UPI001C0F4BF2|nr:ribokinase [Anaerostipes sp. MSJ-23]MBU5459608.1 ribokinase [Anaerostipes sp. MSJ-23]
MERKPKMLVVGSFVKSQIISTKKLPEEGETILGKTVFATLGGKGANQAVQMARLGADVTMIGKIGRDQNGEDLLDACRRESINVKHVLYDAKEETGFAFVVLERLLNEHAKNRVMVIPGANMTIQKEEIAFLEDQIDQYDMVLLQNEIPQEINETVAEYASKKGVPVMLNPAPYEQLSEKLLHSVTYISPNEHEAAHMSGIKIHRDKGRFNLEEAKVAALILKGCGVANVLITLGKSGAFMMTKDHSYYKPALENIEIVDPSAAGEAFVGAFCTRICMGDNIGEAMVYANHAGALAASRIGAMPALPTKKEVEQLLYGQ